MIEMKRCKVKGCKETDKHIHDGNLILFFDGSNKDDYTKLKRSIKKQKGGEKI